MEKSSDRGSKRWQVVIQWSTETGEGCSAVGERCGVEEKGRGC